MKKKEIIPATTPTVETNPVATPVAETPKVVIDTKPFKKDNSAYTNMLTHLKSKGIKAKPTTSKLEELEIIHSIDGTTPSGSKFQIKLSSEIREDNGHKQALLLLNTKDSEYITLKPLTNGQLLFFIEQFVPGIITVKETEKEESK